MVGRQSRPGGGAGLAAPDAAEPGGGSTRPSSVVVLWSGRGRLRVEGENAGRLVADVLRDRVGEVVVGAQVFRAAGPVGQRCDLPGRGLGVGLLPELGDLQARVVAEPPEVGLTRL